MTEFIAFLVFTAVAVIVFLKTTLPEIKNKNKKGFFIGLSFLIAGYGIFVLTIFGIMEISPLKFTENLIRNAFNIK